MKSTVPDLQNSSTPQDQLIDVWTKIARKYAEPTIARYDILNEPLAYNSIAQTLTDPT
jgi:aryl-phospho-beta-D-glucosidase BglC (GH1 family)